MTQQTEMAAFMAAARRRADLQDSTLPEAPLAMPEQDLAHLPAMLSWRRMRSADLVRS